MKVFLILMIIIGTGCSSPTQYISSEKGKQGYSDQIVDNNLRVTTFKGNSSTKKETAELYAKFRAIELCHEQGSTYTHIMLIKDKTYSKEISQVSSTSPNYYYGMSPYYGRYGAYGAYGSGWGVGVGTTSTTVSNETYTYPLFDVYFECTEKPLDARVSLKNLSSSQVQAFVKDLQGAVQVDEVLSDSPNVGKLQKGDIIIKAGGERVAKTLDVYKASRKFLQRNFKVEFFRDGKKKETVVSFFDVSNLVGEAQAEIIEAACKIDGIKGKSPVCKKVKDK